MAQIQEVTPDATDNSEPIFDAEPLQKVQNDNDNYNVFANDSEHREQPKSVNDTYQDEQGYINIPTDSLDMSNNRGHADQDKDDDLARERDLLASLIDKLKWKVVSDLKKFQAELDRYHDVNYASKVENDWTKAKGDLVSYKMESQNFVKPEFLKKAQRANPRLYDIGCYNDNLVLMLAPESDETIRLAQESRSKLIIPTTSVSRPQLKSNRLEDRVMHNNSEGKKQQVEDHRRNFMFSNNKTSVTACNDSLNAKSSNVNFVCVTCGKCVLNDNHDMCVLHYINGVNSRTKMPMAVPIITREPKRAVNQSAAISLKRTIAVESTNQKPRSTIRKQYEQISKTCKWWYCKITPPGYKWKPKSSTVNVEPNVSMHLGTKSRTTNILEPTTLRKSTVSNTPSSSNSFVARRDNFIHRRLWVLKAHDGKSQASKKCHDQQGLLRRRVESQFILRWKSTCFIRNLKGNDLLTGSITLQDTSTPNPICLMAKPSSSQAWLWHHHLSHLNFDTINLISKYDIVTGLPKLKFIKDHLCSSCELGKAKYETPEVLNDFLKLVQRGLHAQVRTIRTDNGMEFLNKTLHAYFAQEGIEHQTSTNRMPEQNGVVKAWNRTLVEAARRMLSVIKVPLFFWVGAIATTCFTRNLSLVIPRHEKTPYHIINGQKLPSRAYRVYNKRTRVIVETIHVNFDELPQMASDHVSSDPVPQCPTTALKHASLSLGPQSQENVLHSAETVTTSNKQDVLFSLMFDELLNENGTTRTKKYEELYVEEKLQADCDLKATNIFFKVFHQKECKLYDEFDKFSFVKGETLYQYYWRFAQLINNMNVINMSMRPVQVNTKFLNSLLPEWSKFVTDVKLASDLHTTNYDQFYSYLKQHERHANETRLTREKYQDPLAFVDNYHQSPSQLNNYHSQYNPTQFPQ
ncbi:retrovirus-related pol polyprotein from transposon TNT 1-94 [Tanacetum coccineum]